MTKWYPYLGTLGLGDSLIAYRPSLEIEICRDKIGIAQMAMVDSGSDATLMDVEIAEYLGINLADCPRVKLSGVTGAGDGFVADVEIHIEKIAESIPLQVVFVKELRTGILLGQKGFFEYFTVTFEKNKNRFGLERNTKNIEK